MHVLLYWLARTALMFVVWLAIFFAGWRHWSGVVAAALVAWLISYAMFGSMHDAAARQLERWFGGRHLGVGPDEEAEDAEARHPKAP